MGDWFARIGRLWLRWNVDLMFFWWQSMLLMAVAGLIGFILMITFSYIASRHFRVVRWLGAAALFVVLLTAGLSALETLLSPSTPWWDRLVTPAAWIYTGGAAAYGWLIGLGRRPRRGTDSPRQPPLEVLETAEHTLVSPQLADTASVLPAGNVSDDVAPLANERFSNGIGQDLQSELDSLRAENERSVSVQTIVWDELEPAAREAFNIWMSGSDLEWAKEAWALLTKAGLCSYGTERGRHIVIGRFLALASIYRDWCSVAFDETHGDVPTYWIEGLNVEPIFIGQILADEELSDDPDDALSEALQILLMGERAAVVQALQEAYGGAVEDLFVALWRSVRVVVEPELGDEDYVDSDYEVLNNATSEKLVAYAWITEGCPNVRP